jgi:hypothetical protein
MNIDLATAAADMAGAFTLNLEDPLYAGEVISFFVNKAFIMDRIVLGVQEWGRVHFDAAAGIVLSVDNNFQASTTTSGNTTQSTLFMALNVEKNWQWAGISGAEWTGRWMFSTYFQTRLTSVPVTTTACQTSDTACGNLSTFLNSAKSAELQGGAYAPILLSRWNWRNVPNSLTIAPLAKVGFITPTGSTPANVVNPGKFYNFYAFGGRIGHFEHSADRNSAPELHSFMDVAWGRFSNLETLIPVFYNNNLIGNAPTRRWRLSIEGLLKVPTVPLVLGFNANLGQNLISPGFDYCGGAPNCTPKAQARPPVLGAKDDLRFFIGTEFDVGKLLSNIPKF